MKPHSRLVRARPPSVAGRCAPARGGRWCGFVVLIMAAVLSGQAAEATKEYKIKAAFLYNFAKFIDWTEQRLPSPKTPIVIGVLDENPFEAELAKLTFGRSIDEHPIAVRLVTTVDEAVAVHVLFVPAGREEHFAALIADLRGRAVATVGESERFASLGGVIAFVREGDKVRFSVDLAAAERAGVKLSAQLLKLATSVRRAP